MDSSPRRDRRSSSARRERRRSPDRKSSPKRKRFRSPAGRDRRRSPSPPKRDRRRSPDRKHSPKRESSSPRSRPSQKNRDNSPKRPSQKSRFSEPESKLIEPKHEFPEPETSSDTMKKEEKPNEKVSMLSFEPSGKLAADTNTFKGVVIKYNEPAEAAKPRLRWRLYPMKGEEVLQPFYVHRQSAYLIGRDRKIADFPVDHPSCSKQHAVLQYRSMPFERNGAQGRRTLPYIIDLASANGTFLNSERIEPQRYYELKEQDILKFGFSQREYVVLHELSAEGKGGEEVDEDIEEEDAVIDREGAEEKLDKQEQEDDYF